MAVQYSVAVRNARQNAVEATVGTGPILQLRTGAQPASCAAADSGTLLATLTLPTDWLNAASAGATTLAGSWSGTVSVAGTVGHFRLKDSGGTVCHMQGSVGLGTGDLSMDNNVVAVSQVVTINTWTTTDGNS
jgi:hypothetical protein